MLTSEWRIPPAFMVAILMYIITSAFTGVWFISNLSTRVTSLEADRLDSAVNAKLLHDIDTRTKVLEVLIRKQGDPIATPTP